MYLLLTDKIKGNGAYVWLQMNEKVMFQSCCTMYIILCFFICIFATYIFSILCAITIDMVLGCIFYFSNARHSLYF